MKGRGVNLTFMQEVRLEAGDLVETPLKKHALCLDPHVGGRARFLYDDGTTVDLHPGHVKLLRRGCD
jgi:hypothetical protein